MMTGLNTFSSKFPWLAAKPIVASFPMICAAIIVNASLWVGLTFPGIMELPGSFSGMINSPIPQRGPLASHLTSLAIFIKSAASAFKAPCAYVISSWLVSAWNLFGEELKV